MLEGDAKRLSERLLGYTALLAEPTNGEAHRNVYWIWTVQLRRTSGHRFQPFRNSSRQLFAICAYRRLDSLQRFDGQR